MIVDSSVWIEFFRATNSSAHQTLERLIAGEERIIVPDIVMTELLIGTTDERVAAHLERTLMQFEVEPAAPLEDALAAARIHRTCRRNGETVRSLADCYVAAMAMRLDVPVLHRDRDFEVIARHLPLTAAWA